MKAAFKWNLVLSALLYFLLGVVLIFWPNLSSMALAYCVGAAAAAYGIFNILAHFFRREKKGLRLELPVGILAGAFGLFTLLRPVSVLQVLPISLGLVLVLSGAVSLRRVFSLRRLGFSFWWVLLLLTLAVMTVGIVAVCNPFLSFSFLLRVIGVALIYSCVSDLWSVHRVSVLAHTLEEQMDQSQEVQQQRENVVDVSFEDISEEKDD